jgi:hypothetical protein
MYQFIWDETETGNLVHLAEHGVTPEEAVDVFEHAERYGRSRSSGLPIVLGATAAGRYLLVVYEEVAALTIYVLTAYDVEPPPHNR